LSKNYKNFNKELKKVKQEKEYLIIQLSESHVLIDSLKSENTTLFNTIDTFENKLKESEDLLNKFSSDNLKGMLCIHIDNYNKPCIIVNDFGAFVSEINSLVIKFVIVDTTCLDSSKNSCLNNCMKPKFKVQEHELMVSLFLLVIIVGRLVTLDQIIFC